MSEKDSRSPSGNTACQPHGRARLSDVLLQLVPAVAAAGRFPLAELYGVKTFGEGTRWDTGIGKDSVRVRVCARACARYRASSCRFPQPLCSYLFLLSNRQFAVLQHGYVERKKFFVTHARFSSFFDLKRGPKVTFF